MAEYRVIAPDGATYQITAPDGATEQDVMQYMQEQIAGQNAEATTATAPPTFGSEAMAAVSGVNQGIAEGLGFLPDALAGAVNLGAKAVGLPPEYRIEKPFGGTESIKSGMTALGIDPDKKAQTTTGRIVREGAREVGAMALPYGLATGAARAGRAGNALVQDMVNSPVKQVVANASAGAGVGVAKEATDNPWVHLGAALLAGAAGATAPDLGALSARYGKSAATGAIAPFTEPGREKIVGSVLRERAADVGKATDALDALGEIVPGSKPTTGMADAGLAGAERGVRAADIGPFATRDAANNEARRGHLDYPTDATAQNTADYIRTRLQEFTGATDDIVARATERAQQRLDELGAGATPQTAGAILRKEFEAAKNAAGAGVSRLYRGIDPEDASRFSLAPLYEEVAGLTNQYFGRSTDGVPADLSRITTRLRAETMSFADLDAIAKDLGNIQGMAQQAGNNTLASAAGDSKKAVIDYIKNNADAGFPKEAAERYAAARQSRIDMGERFEQGASGNVGAKKRFGEPVLSEGEAPGQYFNASRGSADDADKFVAAIGDRPKAVQALTDYAVNDLRNFAAGVDGEISPRKWRQWMRRHQDALSRFPEVQQQMAAFADARSALDRLAGKQARTIADVQKSAAGFFLDRDPGPAVDAALSAGAKSAREMGRLVRLVKGDPDALNGLRRTVLERAIAKMENATSDAAGQRVWSEPTMRNWLRTNRRALETLFPPEHMRNIVAVADDMFRSSQVHTMGRIIGSNTPQDLSTAHFIAKITGGLLDPQNALANSIAAPLRWIYRVPERQVQALLVDAMLDPKLAADIMRKATPQNVESISSRLQARWVAMGGTGLMTSAQDERERRRGMFLEVRPPAASP
jgi:hypothetical protein